MDLLGHLREEAGNKAKAYRTNLRRASGGKTPTMLLARLPASMRDRKASARELSASSPTSRCRLHSSAKHPCKGSPRRFNELPETTRTVCCTLADRLKAALPGTVHGIYLHGAMVFPETDRIVDLDAHSILNRPLSDAEKEAVLAVHRSLTEEFPPLTSDDLDVWYILLEETGQSAPRHQINPDLADTSWALHRAHLRAGYGIVLHGPPPWETFRAPTWPELKASLDGELKFVLDHAARYPAYCVLNACRLMVSYQTRDVVFSKKTSAEWTMDNFRAWEGLIAAALRDYAKSAGSGDRQLLTKKTGPFLEFARAVIAAGKSD